MTERILYTTELGGFLKFASCHPGLSVAEEFERIRETGSVFLADREEYVEPVYVELLEVVDDYDFALDRKR